MGANNNKKNKINFIVNNHSHIKEKLLPKLQRFNRFFTNIRFLSVAVGMRFYFKITQKP